MRLVFVLFLALGIALAGMAVYMAQGQIAQFQRERDYLLAAQKNAPAMIDVVVVKRPLKYGERFTLADLEIIKVQRGKTPAGVFHLLTAPQTAPEIKVAAFAEGETRPRAALRSYEPFEPLLASKVTPPGVDAGIAANLAAGMRAFTMKVDASSGVSGFPRPGSFVDVYWSGSINNEPVTKLIMSSVKLIAIDQSADADRSEETKIARTVTAEVSPEEVATLTLAQSTGKLTLSLVGMSETAAASAIELDRDTLLGIERAAEIRVEKKQICTIRNRKGGELVEVEIPCTN
ncbi:MAG: Flp pilus assembly protein CpaB [Paracoccaceae bacterium]